jgi:hypothetical protein
MVMPKGETVVVGIHTAVTPTPPVFPPLTAGARIAGTHLFTASVPRGPNHTTGAKRGRAINALRQIAHPRRGIGMAMPKRRATGLLLVAMLAGLGQRALATPAARETIQVERETILGEAPREGKRIWRAAVCPDGTVHVTVHDVGLLTTISPAGEIVSSASHPELEGVVSLACDAHGTLYAGTMKGGLLDIRTDRVGAPTITSLPNGNSLIRSMASTESDVGLVALSLGEIPVLNRRGMAIHAFRPGTMPVRDLAADALGRVDDVHPPTDGTLLWDARRRQIIVVPRSRYELLAFSTDGTLRSRTVVGGTAFRSRDSFDLDQTPIGGYAVPDQVIAAAMLPDGRLVVEFTEHPPDAPSRTVLHLLNGPEGSVLSALPVAWGVVVGADATGALYWLRIGRGGPIRLFKTRFVNGS